MFYIYKKRRFQKKVGERGKFIKGEPQQQKASFVCCLLLMHLMLLLSRHCCDVALFVLPGA